MRSVTSGNHSPKLIYHGALAVLLLSFLVLSSIYGFAAFISGGNVKGVAVAGSYHFTSNALRSIGTESEAELHFYYSIYAGGTASLNVEVRNFDTDSIPNSFDVGYRVSCHLSRADSTRTYEVNGTPIGTTPTTLTGTLTGNAKSTGSYLLTATLNSGETDDRETLADVIITACPTSPEYMTGNLLGITLRFSEPQLAFAATGAFRDRYADGTDTLQPLANLAAFLYEVTPVGFAENPSISLRYRSDQLELGINGEEGYHTSGSNAYFTWVTGAPVPVSSDPDSPAWVTFTITANAGVNFDDVIRLTFYRAAGFSATDMDDVAGYVEILLP